MLVRGSAAPLPEGSSPATMGRMARFWRAASLACLPVAILLAVGGRWLSAGIVLVLATSLFWRLRSGPRGSALGQTALEHDGEPPLDGDGSGNVHLPLLSSDQIVDRFGRPGESIYPGIGVMDRDVYLRTGRGHRSRRGMWQATRTAFLTTQRLLIVDEATGEHTSLSLGDIDDVRLEPPAEDRSELAGEMTIEVAFQTDKRQRRIHWDAREADAVLFARTLRSAIAKNEDPRPTTSGALSAPGVTLPTLSVEPVRHGMVELTPDGMAFARTLIPWSELEDVRRAEGEDSLSFVGFILTVHVPDLGSAIDDWVRYIVTHGVSVSVSSSTPAE